ncbi:MAG: PepSY domain-containing protein [Hyphomicrobiaceae bacterium]
MTALAFVSPAFWTGPTHAADEACIDDWSRASRIVSKEGLVSVETLSAVAGPHLGGAIVRTTLCRAGERYVYRLLVRDRNGNLSKVSVDASGPRAK